VPGFRGPQPAPKQQQHLPPQPRPQPVPKPAPTFVPAAAGHRAGLPSAPSASNGAGITAKVAGHDPVIAQASALAAAVAANPPRTVGVKRGADDQGGREHARRMPAVDDSSRRHVCVMRELGTIPARSIRSGQLREFPPMEGEWAERLGSLLTATKDWSEQQHAAATAAAAAAQEAAAKKQAAEAAKREGEAPTSWEGECSKNLAKLEARPATLGEVDSARRGGATGSARWAWRLGRVGC
jgi:hypothetical protein